MESVPDAFRPVPYKAIQIIPDRVVAVLICHNSHSVHDLFLTGQPIGFFHAQTDIPHIRVCHGTPCPLVPDIFYKVNTVCQDVIGNCPGQQRVLLQDSHTMPDAAADAAFLRTL